jgi:hypothetical protein
MNRVYIYTNIICDIPEKKMVCHQNLGPGYDSLIRIISNVNMVAVLQRWD